MVVAIGCRVLDEQDKQPNQSTLIRGSTRRYFYNEYKHPETKTARASSSAQSALTTTTSEKSASTSDDYSKLEKNCCGRHSK